MSTCDVFAHKPLLVVFSINDDFKIALINFHLKPRNCPENKKKNDAEVLYLWKILTDAQYECRDKGHDIPDNNFILIGDFNTIPLNPELSSHGFKNIFGITEHTNVKNTDTYDNIIVHSTFEQRCIKHKVIREHIVMRDKSSPRDDYLTSIDKISDHCPIYADFYY